MNFELTEAEVIRLTGYSRQQIQRLRLGSKQVQGGKTYEAPPVLSEGQDWKRYGRTVMYAADSVDWLRRQKESRVTA